MTGSPQGRRPSPIGTAPELPPGVRLRRGRYQARWRDHRGIEKAKSFGSLAEAEAHLARVQAEKAAGFATRPTTVYELIQAWADNECAGLSDSTLKQREHYVDAYVLPRFADTPIEAVRRGDVIIWREELIEEQELALATAAKALSFLRSSFEYAVSEGWLQTNPTRGVQVRGASARREVAIITMQERARLHRMLWLQNPMWGAVIDLAADAGLRIGEIQALPIRNLDLDDGVVTVDATVQRGYETTIVPPKTHAGRRAVPALGQAACERLRPIVAGRDEEDLVIRGPRGAMLDQGNFRQRVFSPAVERLGLDVTPHDLRHHAVSVWLASGIDQWTAAKWAGHTDIRMIESCYGHAVHRPHQSYVEQLTQGRERLFEAEMEAGRDERSADIIYLPRLNAR